ncbi:MAG: hypothetical protein P0Y56_13130 [Candidatus Andeanibacterium colombiense]|uniref:Uncharacterized protein n=1 Tax=Candidatus Andeanibacterium colombiense TaxID=3121345 RepID=A0AAJ5X5H8_9SPHN|nr:MAG: hypothetical protein P0Y56_13130 [Sphingomonadaceae bacterium]
MNKISGLIDHMLADPRHGWSIGTFGAVGEFMRDEDEDVRFVRDGGAVMIVTPRAGISVHTVPGLQAVAFDTLSSDGETWGQSVAFCLDLPDEEMDHAGVSWLGKDAEALRKEDREADLFDLGVGRGHVRFCARTSDAQLAKALKGLEGKNLFGPEGGAVMGEVLRAQPHRVVISPVGRVEVYAPIPLPGGNSPEGPHTHLLPKMVASGLTHAANSPIPKGLQPVLHLHPRSPWRDAMGMRVPFDVELDGLFEGILAEFGLPQDRLVRRSVEEAVDTGSSPEEFHWPETRRGRTEARIALRRIARTRPDRAEAWRLRYDRLPEPDQEAALHA